MGLMSRVPVLAAAPVTSTARLGWWPGGLLGGARARNRVEAPMPTTCRVRWPHMTANSEIPDQAMII
jgi:hypothetical protein